MSALVQQDRAAMVQAEPVPGRRPAGNARTAADVMTRFPVTVHASASMWTAWDRLRATDSRHLVVVDADRRPVGVLDERTLAIEWPPGLMASHRTPVHVLLRDDARPRVRSGTALAVVARTMLGARADALPVIDREGRLLGLVTLWHLARLVAAGADLGAS